MRLPCDLAGAVDAADGLDRQHCGEVGPVFEAGKDPNIRAGEHPPAHQSAVAPVKGITARAQRRAGREGVGGEPVLYLCVGFSLIAFERDQVVTAPAHDPFGDRRLVEPDRPINILTNGICGVVEAILTYLADLSPFGDKMFRWWKAMT